MTVNKLLGKLLTATGLVLFVVTSNIVGTFLYQQNYKKFVKSPVVEHLSVRIEKNALYVKMGETARASAVFIRDNMALTAAHVCSGMDVGTELIDYIGNSYTVQKYVINPSASTDLCLIFMNEKPNLPGTKIATQRRSSVGTRVYIGGFSGGVFYSYRSGEVIIQQVIRAGPFPMNIEIIKVEGFPGISGSGALNSSGELVGIIAVNFPNNDFELGMGPLYEIQDFFALMGLPLNVEEAK